MIIRLVTSVIILLCVLSRILFIPIYLSQLDYISISPSLEFWLDRASKGLLYFSGITGTAVIFIFVLKAYFQRLKIQATLATETSSASEGRRSGVPWP